MFGFKRVKPTYTVKLRFYPLYKGQSEGQMEHFKCVSVTTNYNHGRVTIVRDDNAIYVYPLKDIMSMSIRPSK